MAALTSAGMLFLVDFTVSGSLGFPMFLKNEIRLGILNKHTRSTNAAKQARNPNTTIDQE
jgi:hypothetical protein